MTEKRFINDIDNGKLVDTKGELSTIHYSDSVDFYELWEFLNKLNDENEQLKRSVNNLKDTIIKITIAYQRKYDRSIVDLVDEVYEEDITDLIKELQECGEDKSNKIFIQSESIKPEYGGNVIL